VYRKTYQRVHRLMGTHLTCILILVIWTKTTAIPTPSSRVTICSSAMWAGTRYFLRIAVGSACLASHGHKDQRPAFVKQGYPEDRAYDFQVGDLRGIYSLFIPDAK